jgi:hypothetical protein
VRPPSRAWLSIANALEFLCWKWKPFHLRCRIISLGSNQEAEFLQPHILGNILLLSHRCENLEPKKWVMAGLRGYRIWGCWIIERNVWCEVKARLFSVSANETRTLVEEQAILVPWHLPAANRHSRTGYRLHQSALHAFGEPSIRNLIWGVCILLRVWYRMILGLLFRLRNFNIV